MSALTLDGFLTSWILHQKKFITYRILSRERSLHVDEARAALQSFLQTNEGSVKATYVIQGQLSQARAASGHSDPMDLNAPAESLETSLLLVGQDKLGSALANFAPGHSSQIYALFPGSKTSQSLTTTDLGLLSSVPLTLSSEIKYTQAWEKADRGSKIGLLYNERVRQIDSKAVWVSQQRAVAQAKTQQQRQHQKSKTVPIKEEQTERQLKAPQGATNASSAHPVLEDSKKVQSIAKGSKPGSGLLDWSKAKSKASKLSAEKVMSKEADQPSDDSDDSDVEMAQIEYADSEQEADEAPVGKTSVKRADGVVKSKPSASTSRSTAKGKGDKSQEEREEERRQLREMMDVEETTEDQAEETEPPNMPANAEASTSLMRGTENITPSKADEVPSAKDTTSGRRKLHRKRRIVRKESGKDAKGYRYTREVSDYESYSEWTDSEEKKPAAASMSKPRSSKSERTDRLPTAAIQVKESSSTDTSVKSGAASNPPPVRTFGGARKGSAGGGAGGGQSKLSSFFKKR